MYFIMHLFIRLGAIEIMALCFQDNGQLDKWAFVPMGQFFVWGQMMGHKDTGVCVHSKRQLHIASSGHFFGLWSSNGPWKLFTFAFG